jgi:hypothetical protein
MKLSNRISVLFFILSIFISCSEKQEDLVDNYFDLKWYEGEEIRIENGNYHSATYFDTVQNKYAGDTMFPIIIGDSTIIITKLTKLQRIPPPYIIRKALKEYIETWNTGKYKSLEQMNVLFPEFQEFTPQQKSALADYVDTWNSGKYTTVEDMNLKFPEFFPVNKKDGNGNDKIINSFKIMYDTFRYEIINFNGPKMVLMNDTFGVQKLLHLDKNENQIVKEFQQFERPNFEVSGLLIGVAINRDDYNFNDDMKTNWGDYRTEVARLKTNHNIIVEIIGDSIIYRIEQDNISDHEIDDIKLVISEKMKQVPKYESPITEIYGVCESYTWSLKGINLILRYFPFKPGVQHGYLIYYDAIMQSILQYEYRNPSPKSSIIK